MTDDEVFEQTGPAYLHLIHPLPGDESFRVAVAPVIALASSVPVDAVAALIAGISWRERLIGLCLAVAGKHGTLIQNVFDSLRDPRGISIVPACAAVAVMARRTPGTGGRFPEDLDRNGFDGELGWPVDCAAAFVDNGAVEAGSRGPNSGQLFKAHAEFFD